MPICSPVNIKIAKTFNLFLAFVSIGLHISILGPTLLDLVSMINKRGSGFFFETVSIGIGVGTLIGGAMMDYFSKRQLTIICFGFVFSISILLVPWIRNYEWLSFLMLLAGFTNGALESGGNVLCLQIWKEKHGPILQAIYFGLGLGSSIGPIMAASFVKPYASPNNEKILLVLNTNGSTTNATSKPSEKSILYIYSISGAFTLLVTFLFCITFVISPEEDSNHQKSKQAKKVKRWVSWTIILLSALVNLFGYGIPLGCSQILTTYLAKGKLHLSKSKGSYMTSVFRISLMIGSLMSSCVSTKMKPLSLTLASTVISLSGSILLLINGFRSEWSLWLGSCFLGFGTAPVLPCSISWTDDLARMNSKISGLFIVAMCCGMALASGLTDRFMLVLPEILFYIAFFSLIISLVCLVILYFVGRSIESRSNQIILKKLTQLYSIF